MIARKYIEVTVIAVPVEDTSTIMDAGLLANLREGIEAAVRPVENQYPEYAFGLTTRIVEAGR